MNRWTRLLTALTVTVTAITLGLSSASASSGSSRAPSWQGPGGPDAPAVSGQHAIPLVLSPSVGQAVFVPLTPCRIADTRLVGGPLGNLAVRTFYVQGTTGFAPQGGKSGGCGVPAGATAVTTNVTTTAAAAPGGYLTGYPNGSPEPLSNFVTYPTATTTVNPTFAINPTTTNSLAIRAHGGHVQVIIDVTGYYAPQLDAIVSPNGTLYAHTSPILSSTRTSTGSYTILTNTDVSNCAVTVTIRGGIFYGDGFGSGNNVYVTTWALNSSATATLTDLYYSFAVTC